MKPSSAPFLKKIRGTLAEIPKVKLGYFFGSRAKAQHGPLSDYDFAFYLDEHNEVKRFKLRLELMNGVSKVLRTDAVDVLILNDTESPELKYEIIKDGILFYQKEPYRVLVEPRILNEYFDFHQSLLYFGLTKKHA